MIEPETTSTDYDSMRDYWDTTTAIWGGTNTMRAGGNLYLPQFPNENETDYEFRLDNSKFTNVFRDIVETLASKPFSKAVQIEGAGSKMEEFIEDVDGRGSDVDTFAGKLFLKGIRDSLAWVLVDYTKGVPMNASVETERSLGVRPFWVLIDACDLIAAYSAVVAGEEQFYHVRIRQDKVVIENGEEITKERIRIFEREQQFNENAELVGLGSPTWQVLERQTDGQSNNKKASWEVIDEGTLTIPKIPLVPFVVGNRKGSSWEIDPPMRSCADLQIELYQQESGLKYAKESTAFPMLAGNGVQPIMDKATNEPTEVPVGPKGVLYAPPNGEGDHGEWVFIEPSSESLRFLAEDVKETINQLRELGRQPLTAQTGNLTVVTTAFAAQKGNSAVMAWALNLDNALNNAFAYTAEWLNVSDEVVVTVYKDLNLALSDDKSTEALLKMRENGDLSEDTLWSQMQRRDILPADFDADEERERILDESPGEDDMLAAMGEEPTNDNDIDDDDNDDNDAGSNAIERMLSAVEAEIRNPANAA